MDKWLAVFGLACLALVSVGCDPGESEQSLQLDSLETPAPEGSFAPRLARMEDGRALLSWLEERDDAHALRFALYEEDGWSTPRTVAEGEDWFANWADTPGVIPVGEKLFAHWLVSSGSGTFEYDIHAAWSGDEGHSWDDSFVIHQDGEQAEHGFLTGVVLPDGDLGLSWLDGRAMAGDPPGPMSLRWARFEPGSSEPRDKQELDERVCDCCMTATVKQDGEPLVFYRDRSENEIRDIARVASEDADWSEPTPVAEDGWEIAGCPVNGPSADAAGDHAAVAWYSAAEGDSRVQWAELDEQGEVATIQRIDAGDPIGRVATLHDEEAGSLVVWVEREEDGAALMARAVPTDGEPAAANRLVDVDPGRGSGFPVLASQRDGALLAWTHVDGGERRVRVAELRSRSD